VALCQVDTPRALLDGIDDMAFLLAQARLSMKFGREPQVGALTWRGYRAFLDGYLSHQLFALTGELRWREEAIELYRQAVAAEPAYALAHHNLATLLYNRYTAADNDETIEHVRKASSLSFDRKTRALALATLAQAYCQQVHRFGHPLAPWGSMALVASTEACSLRPDLAQTRFARGFALQILEGQGDEALEWFNQVLDLPEASLEVQRMKSYAYNNIGYLYLGRGDLETAETHLRSGLELFSGNKMAYTNLGEIARRRQDFTMALEHYGRAIGLDARYVSATNDTGVVFLSMAGHERDRDEVADHLRSANVWHERAIALIPPDAHRHRAFVHARFAEACRDHHFLNEANRWAEESSRESRFLEQPAPVSGENDSSFLGMLGRAIVARLEDHREPSGSPDAKI
jgi:tetratricopeptide (TPR) repeat protein